MATKIDTGNPGFNGDIAIAGEFVTFKGGVAETDSDEVIEQAKASGLSVDDGKGADKDAVKAEKDALVVEAKALNIDVKGTWGAAKLQEEIAKAKAKVSQN